jgi:hypothetical protein
MTNRFRNKAAVLRADAKNLKEPTRASLRGRQSVFRKLEGQEKNIPHPRKDRIQAAAAGLVLRLFIDETVNSQNCFF